MVGNNLGIKQIGTPLKTRTLNESPSNLSLQTSFFESTLVLPRALTLWEAISDLPELGAGEGAEEQAYTKSPETEYQQWIRGDHNILYNHAAMDHSPRMVDRFKLALGLSIIVL